MRLVLLFFTFSVLGFAYINGQTPLKHYNLEGKGIAIQGYDPVAYFSEARAVKGNTNVMSIHNGVMYYFSSHKNKKLFDHAPLKYEPQYGGYCAYAMAEGDKVKINPETFKIVDNKLYLFYDFRKTNTLTLWNKDEDELLSKADKEWLRLIKK